MKALNITPEGTITTVELDSTALLNQLQSAVGGFIETLDLNTELVMVLNEEGKIYRLPTNDIATRLTQHYAVGLTPRDFIAGPVIIAGQTPNHDFIDVTPNIVEVLKRLGFTVNHER